MSSVAVSAVSLMSAVCVGSADFILMEKFAVATPSVAANAGISHVTARRFVAVRWNASRPPAEAAALASAPVAWPTTGGEAINPVASAPPQNR